MVSEVMLIANIMLTTGVVEFVDMLSSMRIGQLSPQLITRFRQLSRPLVYEDGIEASVLWVDFMCASIVFHSWSLIAISFPLRAEVEGHNNSRLNMLTGKIHVYRSMDSRGYNAKGEQLEKDMAQRLLERLVAPRSISLKVTLFPLVCFHWPIFLHRLEHRSC